MREIEFRGKTVDLDFDRGSKWVYGDFYRVLAPLKCVGEPVTPKCYIVFENPNTVADWGMPRQMVQAEVILESIGEYTGLRDKNDKKIFEGDIVRRGYDGPTGSFYNNTPVKYSVNYGGWLTGEHERLTPKTVIKESIEVIGNIHQNKGLLEGKTNE